MRVTFEQAMEGTTVPVRITGPATCHTCHGSGAAPGTSPMTCPECGAAMAFNDFPERYFSFLSS